MDFIDNIPKTYYTCVGEITIKRAYYYNTKTKGYIPLEKEYPYLEDSFFPDIKEISCLISCMDPYGIGSNILEKVGGIKISASSLEKITKEVGGELAKEEDEKVKRIMEGKEDIIRDSKVDDVIVISMDGTHINTKEGWKEVKNGAIYGIRKNEDGEIEAYRKSYVSRIENCEAFGERIYLEAIRHNSDKAKKIITIGDGAQWIWEQFNLHFPRSVQIIDWYHATEHLHNIIELLYQNNSNEESDEYEKYLKDLLYEGDINSMISSIKEKMRKIRNISETEKKKIEIEINYFEKNIDRMQYKSFEEKGYPIGSGVIEGACKNLVQIRMKRNGMRWTINGAHSVLQLRCLYLSNRWQEVEDYLEKLCA